MSSVDFSGGSPSVHRESTNIIGQRVSSDHHHFSRILMNGHSEASNFLDGDIEMVPIATAMDQVAGSLRQLREQWQHDDGDIQMESAFESQDDPSPSDQAFRLLIIDTNILISHLSLIEWLGELLMAARKLHKGSQYQCGLLIPRMVRLELDRHKMPHNRQRMITALLEPPPINASRSGQTSIHSPEGVRLGRRTFSNTTQSIQVSLYEAADQAIKWMSRLFKETPPECCILKFQTINQVADPSLAFLNPTGSKVSPDMQILDCATYFKHQLQARGGGVTLLTNDKALSLEAELEGLSTLRIQPGLSPRSLLYSFDATLAQEIATLFSQVSFADMVTATWYKQTSVSLRKPTRRQSYPNRTTIDNSCSAHEMKPYSKPNEILSDSTFDFAQPSTKAEDSFTESSTHMAIEVDEEMSLSDLIVPPFFPLITYHHILAPSELYEPRLLHLHYHIQQAVAALLRPRLFDFLLRTLANNDLSLLFQHVALVFERKKHIPPMQNSHDPNHWTAVDCLTLIDEFWNEATLKLFEDEDKNESSSKPKLDSAKPITSRWAPSTPFLKSGTNEERNCNAFSSRLSRIRKAIQVLIVQLQPYDLSNLPRDNPQSWSVLFWDGLLEDIHKLIYYGKFYESLGLVEDAQESRDHILKQVIQNWKRDAHHLCESG
ncbi:hypothetical protein PTTG_12018 [Puccinia triticina 1-1 BBBD Race 1]|uniref:PINc domain-containing protein n=1 Tax=Puccinia triticina (isolate 1-1 / race 1 (BBBD)) TaxID=630390 RepID=A0A180H059_PUCT1|nr:hypothetical protein PTTG_12018 [Puccinia triticina 1-1 BBBD Race 1]